MLGDQGPPAEDLALYEQLVAEWAGKLNLVAPGDLEDFHRRHSADSLRLLPLLRQIPDGPLMDVGAGAGLPGVPLAVAERGRSWRFLEPRSRRAAFLDLVVRELELDAEVIAATAQEAGRDPRLAGAHALVTARALAPPVKALSLIRPLGLPGGGIGALFLGRRASVPPGAGLWREGIAIVRF